MKYFSLLLTLFISIQAGADSFAIWKPKNRIEFSDGRLSLDGGSPTTLTCQHDQRAEIGKLYLGPHSFSVSCKTGYLGGFYLGEHLVAQDDGDAGDSWDIQSLLFIDVPTKALVWSVINYSTHDLSVECDGEAEATLKKWGWPEKKINDCLAGKSECKQTESVKQWDPQQKVFVESVFKGKKPERQLGPSTDWVEKCTRK